MNFCKQCDFLMEPWEAVVDNKRQLRYKCLSCEDEVEAKNPCISSTNYNGHTEKANVGEHQSDDEDDDEEELQAQEYIQRTFDPALPRMRKTCQGECGNFKVVYTPVSVTDMSLEYVCSDKECAFFWKQKDELAVEADMI